MKHDPNLTLERPPENDVQIRVGRRNGVEMPVKLRLLAYDGCEFESHERFAVGEQISIHIYRMGKIRGRVIARHRRVVEVEFIKDCPV